jgi:hypothetical protein
MKKIKKRIVTYRQGRLNSAPNGEIMEKKLNGAAENRLSQSELVTLALQVYMGQQK